MEKRTLEALIEQRDGKLLAVASTEVIDRVGDSLKVIDWDFKNFKRNPVLQAGHIYFPQYTIGVAKNIRIEGKRVIFEPVFHDITQMAREIEKIYQEGYLKAFSVGYIPAGKEGGKNELLEISAVAVPANPEALMTGQKSIKATEVKNVANWVAKKCQGKECELLKNSEPIADDLVIKPFPNEHACRLRNPGDFKPGSFRSMTRTSNGKKYRVIMGRLKGETTLTEQSYRYKKKIWTEDSARKHCKAHKGSRFEPATGEKKDEAPENEVKEGRVLSAKNKKIITEAISVLQRLLEMTETPKKDETPEEEVEKKERKPIDIDRAVLRALQKIAKNSNFALSKLHNK